MSWGNESEPQSNTLSLTLPSKLNRGENASSTTSKTRKEVLPRMSSTKQMVSDFMLGNSTTDL